MGPAERKRETDVKHAAMEQNSATRALDDSGLDQVSGGGGLVDSISDMKAEATARYENAMNAAAIELGMGIAMAAAGAASAAGAFAPRGKHR
jgi:hypothetical protein